MRRGGGRFPRLAGARREFSPVLLLLQSKVGPPGRADQLKNLSQSKFDLCRQDLVMDDADIVP